MIINNYFLISFLITLMIHMLNFETHQSNNKPRFFNSTCSMGICNIQFHNGSLQICNHHIHHWFMGLIGLILTFFLNTSIIKNILQGFLISTIIDGLLFSDRFIF
jgi:hypothetical protein